MIFFSCLPWVDITALTNERDFDPNDAIPRVAWGKYVEENGRETLGLSLEINHRFIDGLHIGRFAEALQRRIEALEI
jgi:chloramphenicol O-acetyltransferase type A